MSYSQPWYAAASSATDASSQVSSVSSSSSGSAVGGIVPPPPPLPLPPQLVSAPIINPPVAGDRVVVPEGVPAYAPAGVPPAGAPTVRGQAYAPAGAPAYASVPVAAYAPVGVGVVEPAPLAPGYYGGPRPEGLSAAGSVQPGRTQRKVLIIVSGEDHLDLLSGKRKETGFFLSELAVPYLKLKAQGYETVFANPNGRRPHMDPNSDSRVFFGFSSEELNRAKTLLAQDPSFQNPAPFYALTEKDLAEFRGVFIPGGHAPMQDLYNNAELGRIITHFHRNMKPTAAICHGPAALLPARASDGSWLYYGYGMCCYSNKEELPIEWMWWDTVPHKLETLLLESGANMLNGMPLADRVVEDRELVTGQNPRSVERLASRFVEKLNVMP